MYLIVKGISYSTINSSLSMSSLCDHCWWRTTASIERVKGLRTGWNTNTQTYLKLFDYQSAPPALEDKNKKDVWNHATFQKKKTSTELLLGIYLTKLTEEERRRRKSWALSVPGLGRGKRPHTPHSLSLLLPAAGAESERDWLSCWLGTSGFFLQYSDPLHP